MSSKKLTLLASAFSIWLSCLLCSRMAPVFGGVFLAIRIVAMGFFWEVLSLKQKLTLAGLQVLAALPVALVATVKIWFRYDTMMTIGTDAVNSLRAQGLPFNTAPFNDLRGFYDPVMIPIVVGTPLLAFLTFFTLQYLAYCWLKKKGIFSRVPALQ